MKGFSWYLPTNRAKASALAVSERAWDSTYRCYCVCGSTVRESSCCGTECCEGSDDFGGVGDIGSR